MKQLLSAVKDMHAFRVVHRDITADNILVTNNGTNVRTLKLIGFGQARQVGSFGEKLAEEIDAVFFY